MHFSIISEFLQKVKAKTQPERIQQDTSDTKEKAKEVVDDSFLFPSWPPANPREVLARREYYKDRLGYREYSAPEGVFENAPLYSLYRLYEWIMVGHEINVRNELEVLWWTRWPVSSIPDPGEQGDPERYAVLACIPALIVESFNERINNGLRREEPHAILPLDEQLAWVATPKVFESEPKWVDTVPPLETLLHIPHDQPNRPQLISLDDPNAEPAFKKRNILAIKPHIHFI